MAEEMNSSEEKDTSPEAREAAQWRSRLNALVGAGVFLLGFILTSGYEKKLVPFLFLIPLVLSLVNKARQAAVKSWNPASNRTYVPPAPDKSQSVDPYTYAPKDPKDPRRYKPIG